jgi:hypothetical protein
MMRIGSTPIARNNLQFVVIKCSPEKMSGMFRKINILGAVKFSDFRVQAFRLANLSIWTPNLFMKIRKPAARVEYNFKKANTE